MSAGNVSAIYAPDGDDALYETATIERGSLAEVIAAAEALPEYMQRDVTIYLEDLTAFQLPDAKARLATTET